MSNLNKQMYERIETWRNRPMAVIVVAWSPRPIVGSGASTNDITMCKHLTEAMILGFSLNGNVHCEIPVGEEKVRRFVEVWNA